MIKSLHFLKNHVNLYKDFTYMKFQMSFNQLVDFIVGSMWETFYLFDLRINKIKLLWIQSVSQKVLP